MTDELNFYPSAKTLFTVNNDGTVTIPAGVTLDEATAAFWTAVVAKGPAARIKALENKIEELELELFVRLPIQEKKAELRARIAELEAALKEVHRRTGLLMTQNQGRWNMSLEHDRRTADVLSVNQDITSAAIEGEKG